MELWDLLVDPGRRRFAAVPEADPLSEEDVLREVQLLDVRFEVSTGSAWLLLDLRGAVSFMEGNTAVLGVHGVRELSWQGDQPGRWTANMVVGSRPVADGHGVDLATTPGGELRVRGTSSEFWVGDTPGGDEAPPDFTADDDSTIRA